MGPFERFSGHQQQFLRSLLACFPNCPFMVVFVISVWRDVQMTSCQHSLGDALHCMVTICERSSGCGTVGIVGVWYCGYCQDKITLSFSDGKVQINIPILKQETLSGVTKLSSIPLDLPRLGGSRILSQPL